MSDLGLQSPFAPGSPEEQQYNRGQIRGFGLGLTNMPVGAASQLLPDPNAPGAEKLIPGVVSGTYSAADTAQIMAQHYLLGVPDAHIMHMPGGVEAGKLYEGSRALASDLIPHMHPQNAAEEEAANIGDTAGAVALPIPGAAALPRGVRQVVQGLFQGPSAVAPTIAIGTAQRALLEHSQAQAAPSQVVDNPTNDGQGLGLFEQQQGAGGDNPLLHTDQPMVEAHNVPPELQGPIDGAATKSDGQGLGLFSQAQAQTQNDGQGLGLFAQKDDQGLGLFAPTTQAEQDEHPWLTWGKSALFGVGGVGAALLAGKAFKGFRNTVGEAKYLAESTRINDAAALNGGVVTDTVPLPGAAGSNVTAYRQNNVDTMAIPKEYLKATAETPLLGDQLQAKLGDMTQSQAITQRYMYSTQSGVMHDQKMPPLFDWYQDHAKLTDQQKDLLQVGMNYGNELDNRRANMAIGSTDAERRVNFTQMDDATLRQGLNDALADPAVKDLIERHQAQTTANIDMMLKANQISPGEAARMKSAHQYFVPSTDLDNIITNPMNNRNITPYSGTDKLADFSQIKDQHAFALYKMVEDNRARDLMISNGLAYQDRTGTAQLFQASKNPETGAWVPKGDKSSIAVRREGELQHYTVNNRPMLDAMQNGMGNMSSTLAAWSKLRQLSQSGMTGIGALATGHVFPAINSWRSAGEISVLRPAGMRSGYIDRAVQSATGGKLAFRGDPTAYLGTAYHQLADPAAETARWLGELWAPNAPNLVNTKMRAVFGDKVMDGISQRAIAVYDMSNRAAMREQGLLSSAGYTGNDVTARTAYGSDFLSGDRKALMPSWDMVPENFQMNNLAGAAPTYVRLKNLFNEVRGAIGDAAHSNFFADNKGNSRITPEQLRYEVRNATGDPGTHGAGSFLDSTVPFRNIAKQEIARVGRSLNEQPIGTILGFINHYGMLAAASVYSAMLAGPQAVQHLFDQTTDVQRSTDAQLYNPMPGYAESPLKVPLQINMRAPYNYMLQFMHDAFSLPSHADDPDMASRVMHWFSDLFSKHVWQSTIGGTVEGMNGLVPPLMPAGVQGAVTGLTGKTIDITPGAAYKNRNKPISDWFSYDSTGMNGSRVPGQSAGRHDPITNTVDGGIFGHVFTDILASAGTLVMQATKDASNTLHAGGGLSDVLSALGQEYKMRVADSTPGMNMLWNIPDKLSANSPLQESVERTMDAVRPMVSWKNDMKNFGLTRNKGPELAVPQTDPNTPADPQMQELYATAGKYAEFILNKEGSPMKAVQDDRKQIASLERSNMNPIELRSVRNGYIKDMQDNYVKVRAIIHMMNDDLSAQVGKQVNVEDIDWKKGMEQFTAPSHP